MRWREPRSRRGRSNSSSRAPHVKEVARPLLADAKGVDGCRGGAGGQRGRPLAGTCHGCSDATLLPPRAPTLLVPYRGPTVACLDRAHGACMVSARGAGRRQLPKTITLAMMREHFGQFGEGVDECVLKQKQVAAAHACIPAPSLRSGMRALQAVIRRPPPGSPVRPRPLRRATPLRTSASYGRSTRPPPSAS